MYTYPFVCTPPHTHTQQRGKSIFNVASQLILMNEQLRPITALMRGHADAAFIRSDLMELQIARGLVNARDVRLLEPVSWPSAVMGFNTTTTNYYPEWPIAVVNDAVPILYIVELAKALASLAPDSPENRAWGVAQWVPPLDYTTLHSLHHEINYLQHTVVDGYRCIRSEDLHDVLSCPPGFFKVRLA